MFPAYIDWGTVSIYIYHVLLRVVGATTPCLGLSVMQVGEEQEMGEGWRLNRMMVSAILNNTSMY